MSDIRNSNASNPFAASAPSALQTNKVLRSTYALLSMTLLFSAVSAYAAMSVGLSGIGGLICFGIAFAMLWFVIPKTANSSMGIVTTFIFTGLMGASIAPMLDRYLGMPNGASYVMQALGGTAMIFLTLSAWVLTSKKDFSFMGGMLMVGMMVVIGAILLSVLSSLFGWFDVSLLQIAISSVIVLLMSGFILYDTSRIVNGGETNYILATIGLYITLHNLFTSLLHLVTAFSGDD